MRQRTNWLFRYPYRNGQLRIGYVHNLNPRNGRIRDVVRLEWSKSGKPDIYFYMRPDEAMAMVAGLSWVVGEKWVGSQEWRAQKKERAEGKRDRFTGETIGH